MMPIRFPKICSKYIELQCNNAFSDYVECPELQPILPILEELDPKQILELGAGIGRGSVYLHNNLSRKDAKFYLVDGNSGDEQVAGINDVLQPAYYNSFDAVAAYCHANGIDRDHLTLVDATHMHLGDHMFDLCFSIKAIGFHWPIKEYLDLVANNMRAGALLCFEVRNPNLYDKSRQTRLSRYVDTQISSVDQSKYAIISHVTSTKFHLLLLERNQ